MSCPITLRLSLHFLTCRDLSPIPVRDAIDGLVSDAEIEQFLLHAPMSQKQVLLECFMQAREILYKAVISKCDKQWRQFGRDQFSGHAKVMFSYVSKEEKQFLSADHVVNHNGSFDPDAALKSQSEIWSSRWHPNTVDPSIFAAQFQRLWEYCKKWITPVDFTPDMLCSVFKGYKKKAPWGLMVIHLVSF